MRIGTFALQLNYPNSSVNGVRALVSLNPSFPEETGSSPGASGFLVTGRSANRELRQDHHRPRTHDPHRCDYYNRKRTHTGIRRRSHTRMQWHSSYSSQPYSSPIKQLLPKGLFHNFHTPNN